MSLQNDIIEAYRMLFQDSTNIDLPSSTDLCVAVRLIQSRTADMTCNKLRFTFDDGQYYATFDSVQVLDSQLDSCIDLTANRDLFKFIDSRQGVIVFFVALCLHHLRRSSDKCMFMKFCMHRCHDVYKAFVRDFCEHASKLTVWQQFDIDCLELILTCFICKLQRSQLAADFTLETILSGLDPDWFANTYKLGSSVLLSIRCRLEEGTKILYSVPERLSLDDARYILRTIISIVRHISSDDRGAVKLVLSAEQEVLGGLSQLFGEDLIYLEQKVEFQELCDMLRVIQ